MTSGMESTLRRLALLAVCAISCSALGAADPASPSFHFTVTSDLHLRSTTYTHVLDSMIGNCGGQGVFQVSVGDLVNKSSESPQPMRDLIDAKFGQDARWFPAMGNHDAGKATTREAIEWRYAEYNTGHGVRMPLKQLIGRAGPAGTTETTYSWDYANAHFVVLNEYWNGDTAPGSDTAADGNIVPALRAWLETDLAANTKPFVFVFGHEPPFPRFRHVRNSLDEHREDRDAFGKVLTRYHVQAFICGHIHYYYKEMHDGVWEISDGNAGNGDAPHYQSYLDIIVGPGQAEIRVWQNDANGGTTWHLADTTMVQAVEKTPPAHPAKAVGRP